MRKIAIIGAGNQLAAAKTVIEKRFAGTVEVVSLKELGEKKQDEPFIIKAPPVFEEPFFPKAKHSPKGHQRPYKFHR